jgi:hypothetical protein
MILLRTRLSTADYQHHSKHLLLQVLILLYQRIQAKHAANPVAMHSWQFAVQCLCERIATVGAATASQSPSSAKAQGRDPGPRPVPI